MIITWCAYSLHMYSHSVMLISFYESKHVHAVVVGGGWCAEYACLEKCLYGFIKLDDNVGSGDRQLSMYFVVGELHHNESYQLLFAFKNHLPYHAKRMYY